MRRTETLRRMVREAKLSPDDLILPLYVCPGTNVKTVIPSIPGNYIRSVDLITEECTEAWQLGIPAVIIYGLAQKKDDLGSEATDPDSAVARAVRAIKIELPDLVVITDVCLCEYTSHGHCGVVRDERVMNDPTLGILADMASLHADCGADIVAPSDMMDGRVEAIRESLDAKGLIDIAIMSYAVKYASAFNIPLSKVTGTDLTFGDRLSYEMDPANADEAMREVRLDLEEGADIIMVKPALPNQDVLLRVKNSVDVPVAGYNVAGVYSAIKAADEKGWLDGNRAMMETLTSIKRAGADMIPTWFAKDAARIMAEKNRLK